MTTTPTAAPADPATPADASASISTSPRTELQIDVWSDVECPWCYIGTHRLERAIAASPHRDAIRIRLHSYQLDPRMSHEAIANVDRVAAKYGISRDEAAHMDGRVAAIAHREGLPFVADRLLANSFDVHRVLHLADGAGLAPALLERLQGALFSGAANIYDHGVLTELAVQVGLPRERVMDVLAGDEYADAVRADLRSADELGITGVPFTVFDGRLAVPGAASATALEQLLEQAWGAA